MLALSLYRGTVRHARLRPRRHRFAYSIAAILIDLDRLAEADGASWLFSVNRPNLVAFHERDHGPRNGSSLRRWVDGLLQQARCEAASSVVLLCYPTVLGYVFNPLSVYFCYGGDGRPVALIYQVHNTFGDNHSYVEPVRPDQITAGFIQQRRAKRIYVSPFMEMSAEYHFRVAPPRQNVCLHIRETDADGSLFFAAFDGERVSAGGFALAKTVLQSFAIPWKVIAAIHFEALRLWWKGLKLQPRPLPPPPASLPQWPQGEKGRIETGHA